MKKGWKTWPSWLKGVVIGGVTTIFYLFALFLIIQFLEELSLGELMQLIGISAFMGIVTFFSFYISKEKTQNKTWLRDGFIGIIAAIYTLIILLLLNSVGFFSERVLIVILMLLVGLVGLPVAFIITPFFNEFEWLIAFAIIIGSIGDGFIYGMFVGWIVRKLKSRRKKK